jgi:hypothetical protein
VKNRLNHNYTTVQVTLVAVLLAMGISWIDIRVPDDYGIAMLYVAPLIVARWWGTRASGVFIAVFCTFAEVYTNYILGAYTHMKHPGILYYGITLHLVAYLGISFTLTWVKGLILKEKMARIAECAAKEELQEALANVRELEGLLPICSWCKKIRDDSGFWIKVEGYISQHSRAKFTHGICPDCKPKFLEGSAKSEPGQ